MRYSEAIDYLDGKVVLGVKPSLDRIGAVCSMMGNPQGAYDCIHITGTNGKTSVARMTGAILQSCGYKAGLFTSPHLETVRERISVDGRQIPTGEFARTMADIIPVIEKAEKKLAEPLTYFEVVTAAAFRHFQQSEIKLAVLEVGMGGRWDATNMADGDVAVITNVDIDHKRELGSTKKRIASEKVGIIKEGSMVITAESDGGILSIISNACDDAGAELKVFGRDFRLDYVLPYNVPGEPPSQMISVHFPGGVEFNDIKLPLIGKHQAINAACAVAAARSYTDPRERTSVDAFKRGLQTCVVPGRLEILARNPLVVADGAHNVLGVDKLTSSLTGEFDYDKLVIVVSILEDKDARGILKVLGAVSDELIITENRSARSIAAERLGDYCRIDGIKHRVKRDFPAAIRTATEIAGPDGVVCITGSLYTVSEARIFYRHQRASREMRQDR